MAGNKRKSLAANAAKPPAGGVENAPVDTPSASAFDQFKAHVAKRQVNLEALLARNSAPDAVPAAPAADGAQLAKLVAELERVRSKHEALRAVRETEPERLHAQTAASAAEAQRAAEGVICKLKAEKEKVLEDMAELTTAIASMETVVKERESLVRENARLRAALESAQIADGGAAPAQTLTPQRATPSKPARPPAAASALGEDEAAGVALRLRVYELLTRLQLTAVNTADGEPAVLCRGQQRGAAAGEGLCFSLFYAEASDEVDFSLMANTLRGVGAEQLPDFLQPQQLAAESEGDEGEEEAEGGMSITFKAKDAGAFFTKIAMALAIPP